MKVWKFPRRSSLTNSELPYPKWVPLPTVSSFTHSEFHEGLEVPEEKFPYPQWVPLPTVSSMKVWKSPGRSSLTHSEFPYPQWVPWRSGSPRGEVPLPTVSSLTHSEFHEGLEVPEEKFPYPQWVPWRSGSSLGEVPLPTVSSMKVWKFPRRSSLTHSEFHESLKVSKEKFPEDVRPVEELVDHLECRESDLWVIHVQSRHQQVIGMLHIHVRLPTIRQNRNYFFKLALLRILKLYHPSNYLSSHQISTHTVIL